ncbi:MAG: L-threonylcarbamoyladenylate synthase [Nitrososphaeria archaeon]
MTRIIRVDPVNFEPGELAPAAEAIRTGGLVAFPTETVYGLGADAFNGRACLRIFEVKQRPADNPLIVHISSFDQLNEVAEARRLEALKRAWPGPLTVILRKRPGVPAEVTAGLDTVAVRMPAHPVALRLIEMSERPIAAPSANISGRPSPTTGRTVIRELYGRVDVIIDAGETFFGVESTIVDLTKDPPVLLRPGPFTPEELEALFGEVVIPEEARGVSDFKQALAPGMKYRHYAPQKRLLLALNDDVLKDAVEIVKVPFAMLVSQEKMEELSRRAGDNVRFIVLGTETNLYTVARSLFESFRRLDELDVKFGLIQAFEEQGIGLAIMNRIRKACGRSYVRSAEELMKEISEL